MVLMSPGTSSPLYPRGSRRRGVVSKTFAISRWQNPGSGREEACRSPSRGHSSRSWRCHLERRRWKWGRDRGIEFKRNGASLEARIFARIVTKVSKLERWLAADEAGDAEEFMLYYETIIPFLSETISPNHRPGISPKIIATTCQTPQPCSPREPKHRRCRRIQ